MNKNLKISVITPSYNSGEFIERAIKSVISQDYENWEHIIVDGQSSDKTIDILKKYKHLKWISEKDNGQADAMNKGFKMSKGNVIVYLNADDYFLRGAFSSVIDKFNSGSKFVVGNILIKSTRLESEFINVPKSTFNEMLRHWEPNAFCHNPVGYFYNREVQENCPFNLENYATMDLEFLLDVATKYDFDKIDVVLGCFEDAKNTKTGETQARLDYWQSRTFPYLQKYINKMSLGDKLKYEKNQRMGYVKMQSHMNKMNVDDVKQIKKTNEDILPLISIIIPNYNCEQYICRAIDSVLDQDIDDLEIIIIDDSSTDNSVDVIRNKYGDRVKLIVNKENKKLGVARNVGLNNANGKYVFFLDSDDWIEDGCLKHLVSIAQKYKVEIVSCGINKSFNDGTKEFYHGYDFACSGGIEAINYFNDYKIGSIVWNKLYLRDFIESNNLRFIDKYWHEDVIFTLKCIFLCDKYISISNNYLNYFQRNNSIVNKKQTKLHLESYFNLYKEVINFIKKNDLWSSDYKKVISEKLLYAHCINFMFYKMNQYRKDNPEEFGVNLFDASIKILGADGVIMSELFKRSINNKISDINFDIKQSKSFRLGNLFFRSIEKPHKLITYPYNFIKILLEK